MPAWHLDIFFLLFSFLKSTIPCAIESIPSTKLRSRFFVDFPEEAARNDVTLPAGRVFFSSACWDPTGLSEADASALQAEIDAVDGRGDAGILATPSGVQLLDAGGLTIKRNDWRNGWGAFGDVMLILGRYSLTKPEGN